MQLADQNYSAERKQKQMSRIGYILLYYSEIIPVNKTMFTNIMNTINMYFISHHSTTTPFIEGNRHII